MTRYLLVFVVAILLATVPERAFSTPQFARKYARTCATCHSAVPKLNQFGEDFLVRGYRFPEPMDVKVKSTIPLAVWATARGQWDLNRDRARGLPNRIELISAGPIGKTRASYFVEWLPLSQEVGGNNQRVERHGRFEDLFVNVPIGRFTFTTGQYRALSQVDVSRRLSISEPLAFSTGIAGENALSARLTGLRSFSLSGRSPSIKIGHHWHRGKRAANGLYTSLTVPFAGEFVIPLTERVRRERNFEFEFRPKGLLLETYYKQGLSSIGGHAFVGDQRSLLGLVGTYNFKRFYSTVAVGRGKEISGATDVRFSWENEIIPWKYAAFGLRWDDRTGRGRPAALIPYANFYFPLSTYTMRVTAEHRQQRGNRQWLLEAGVVF